MSLTSSKAVHQRKGGDAVHRSFGFLDHWIAQERRRLARQAEATARVPYKELQRQHLNQHLKRLAGKHDVLYGQELASRFAADNPFAVLGAATGDVLEALSSERCVGNCMRPCMRHR